jgi:16S rRNA (cytidine1402-2'-O)-methyltransferase
MGKVFLIPCPLAENSIDSTIPLGVKETIASVDYFLVEDVRSARRYLSALKLGLNIDSLHFYKVDKDTSITEVQNIFKSIPEDKDLGILSEAGCPGIADPGSLVAKIAHTLNKKVVPLVGPSSILLALMASGFNGQSFSFHGYLPIEKEKRIQSLKSLEKKTESEYSTQIFIETPYRNMSLMEDILSHCNPKTKLCVAANITHPNEEYIHTKSIAQWKKTPLPSLHKIPCIFLIGN